jgi:hypothetical protein
MVVDGSETKPPTFTVNSSLFGVREKKATGIFVILVREKAFPIPWQKRAIISDRFPKTVDRQLMTEYAIN